MVKTYFPGVETRAEERLDDALIPDLLPAAEPLIREAEPVL